MWTFWLVAVICLTLIFDFINGFHDTANAVATSVSTRVLSPMQAILMAAFLNLAGALLSESVAETVAKGLLRSDMINEQIIIAAGIIAAIVWNLVTWYFSVPSSSTHALFGGLIGSAVVYTGGFSVVQLRGVLDKAIIPLITSPIIGFALGFYFMLMIYKLLNPFSQRTVNKWFSKLQILSAGFMAFEHGSNDAQKSMGIITLALISAKILPSTADVPIWVKLICASAMAFGTCIGGWKIIKTVGINMIKLQPVNGFAAETASAMVIAAATYIFKAPVSTTHIISSSIMGVGATKRLSAVRWSLARNIVWAWILTIPLTAVLGAIVVLIFKIL